MLQRHVAPRGVALGELGARREARARRARRRAAVARVVGLGPVAEQRAEVDERVAERRHVPVEDRLHAVGIGGVELAVVELQVVVHEGRAARGGQARGEARVDLVEARLRLVARERSTRFQPATWRSTKPSGFPRSASPAFS